MKTILFIEDNNDIRENTAEILTLAGYNVLTASNGKDGVVMAMEHNPDLIICDIMMPQLDGYGVIHLLQKNASTQAIPFIFLSAKAERTEIRKGMELGADDYITKPFTATELLGAVESRLRKSDILKTELAPGLPGLDVLINVNGKEALQNFTKDRVVNTIKKKQVIYTEGNNPYRLFFIQKGKVKTYKTNSDGKDLVLNLYNEGDFFGYLALIENSPYKESAEAIEPCEIAVIPKEEFESLLNSDMSVMRKFMQLLANNMSEKEDQLLNLAYSSLRKKVAVSLVTLYRKYKTSEDKEFSIDMSRENLANITGTAKESLIRTLGDFKDEKLIDIRDGNIIILNEKKLANLLN